MSPSTLTGSPAGSKTEFTGAEETPFLDFDYDFGPDASFDFDFGNTTAASNPPKAAEGGEQPEKDDGSSTGEGDTESPEKRGHPEDEPEEGGGKRRESAEKVAKKPGRKPLTSEPSSVCLAPARPSRPT